MSNVHVEVGRNTSIAMEETNEEFDERVKSKTRLQDYLNYLGANLDMYIDIAKHDLGNSYDICISTLGKLKEDIINNIG